MKRELTAESVKSALAAHVTPGKKELLQRFFKTGKGQYAEGDVFIGVMVPQQRAVAKEFLGISFSEIQKLLDSKVHEHRLTGLLILTYQYAQAVNEKGVSEKPGERRKKEIYDFYLKNTKAINNWDLVDVTTPNIVGEYLATSGAPRDVLYRLVKSRSLWERRIAVLATFAFIRRKEFDDSLRMAELLLKDDHDLLHKATGWMLREIGKRDEKELTAFLDKHAAHMPRTMLRYAIERLSERKRRMYLRAS